MEQAEAREPAQEFLARVWLAVDGLRKECAGRKLPELDALRLHPKHIGALTLEMFLYHCEAVGTTPDAVFLRAQALRGVPGLLQRVHNGHNGTEPKLAPD